MTSSEASSQTAATSLQRSANDTEQNDQADKTRKLQATWKKLILCYFICLTVTLVASAFIWSHLHSAKDKTNPSAEASANVDCSAPTPDKSSTESQSIRIAIHAVKCDTQKILKHFPDDILWAIIQWGVVISISIQWFITFLTITVQKHLKAANSSSSAPSMHMVMNDYCLIAWSVIPAFIFAGVMHELYNPAVMAMALAAIFVAAEHYGGLKEQEETLEESQSQLDALKTHTKALGEASKNLDRNLNVLLNSSALLHRKETIYNAYAEECTINAVVRYFDIDSGWWGCAKSTTSKGAVAEHEKYRQYWDAYCAQECCPVGGSGRDRAKEISTLYHVLANNKKLSQVLFVSDLPMPTILRDSTSNSVGADLKNKHAEKLATFFRDILGLSWQLVVLNKVRVRVSSEKVRPEWKISTPLSWTHVVGDHVYQVTQQRTMDPTAYELTMELSDEKKKAMFSAWSRQDITRAAERGCMAEEYVFALLRYAALRDKVPDTEILRTDHIERILLTQLGLSEWLALEAGPNEIAGPNEWFPHVGTFSTPSERKQAIIDLCVAIFIELIAIRQQRCPYPIDRENVRFSDLALETL